MAFYADRAIQAPVALIRTRQRRESVIFSEEKATQLLSSEDPYDKELGELIKRHSMRAGVAIRAPGGSIC